MSTGFYTIDRIGENKSLAKNAFYQQSKTLGVFMDIAIAVILLTITFGCLLITFDQVRSVKPRQLVIFLMGTLGGFSLVSAIQLLA